MPLSEPERRLVEHPGIAVALRAAVSEARRTSGRPLPPDAWDDSVSDALWGVVLAARAWRPERGSSFSSYAGFRARGEIRHGRRRRSGARRQVQGVPVRIEAAIDSPDETLLRWADPDPVGRAVEDADLLRWAWTRLSERERQAVLAEVAGPGAKARLAQQWGRSAGVVSQTLRAMRARMRGMAEAT